MIVTKKVQIKVTKRNIKQLKEKYSNNIELGDILNIHPNYLSGGSNF